MSSELLIVKNITREGPGLLEEIARSRQVSYDIVDLDAGQEFPSPQEYKALVVLGGPDSANDDTSKMTIELTRIKEALDLRLPYLGICLGLQTLVKAVGGQVVKNDVREIGLRDPKGKLFTIKLTQEGKSDPLFQGLEDPFKVFHLHGETVQLDSDMKLLGTGEFCTNQAVRVGINAYGLQCHFELTEEMLETWLREDPDLLQLDQPALRQDFNEIKNSYTQTGIRLLNNFLDIAGF
jgi:GMP synthase (glutamine-hydrolysing)